MSLPAAAVARAHSRTARWLVAVGGAWSVAQLVAVGRVDLGWDETVYTSQVSAVVPAAYFSAPRARGISWLVAPVAAVSDDPTAIRGYLAVACPGSGWCVAYWPWLRLHARRWSRSRPGCSRRCGSRSSTARRRCPTSGSRWPRWPPPAGSSVPVGDHRPPAAGGAALRGGASRRSCARSTRCSWRLPLLVAVPWWSRWRDWRRLLAVGGGLAAGTVPWVVEAMHVVRRGARPAAGRLTGRGRHVAAVVGGHRRELGRRARAVPPLPALGSRDRAAALVRWPDRGGRGLLAGPANRHDPSDGAADGGRSRRGLPLSVPHRLQRAHDSCCRRTHCWCCRWPSRSPRAGAPGPARWSWWSSSGCSSTRRESSRRSCEAASGNGTRGTQSRRRWRANGSGHRAASPGLGACRWRSTAGAPPLSCPVPTGRPRSRI